MHIYKKETSFIQKLFLNSVKKLLGIFFKHRLLAFLSLFIVHIYSELLTTYSNLLHKF